MAPTPTQPGQWFHDTALQPSPSKEYCIYRKRAAVKIELTRPANRNALTSSMVDELKALYDRLARDASVFRIYLTGQGKVFCAGMDLGASGSATSANEQQHISGLEKFQGLLRAIEKAPQVTVALINGPCYGGGNGLAFANDIRVSTREATFNLTEVRLGLSPCAISPVLAREWGVPLLRSAMLTATPVTAARLHVTGAIFALADDNEQLQGQASLRLEDALEACAPGASAVCKELAEVAWSSPGGAAQNEVVRRRYLEMMGPSREARFGIGQFRQGVRKVDWMEMDGGKDSKL
ncbi:hypothetical protein jhhlp_008459 [Lomentospora prolificans]|uniref:Enoyl-CoA hydratase n=1 Tax=Lomentospora prolificans TaxID=41688 RepID=A0A2N3MY46_9PEZI|nr:hypothetical protein jhhlp_008459 [Lomentospora prolificans]